MSTADRWSQRTVEEVIEELTALVERLAALGCSARRGGPSGQRPWQYRPPVAISMRIALATLVLFTVGEPWPRWSVATLDRAEVERAPPRRAGWYTITWGGRPLAICMPEDEHTHRITAVLDSPRVMLNGQQLDLQPGPRRRAPQGAKRRRSW